MWAPDSRRLAYVSARGAGQQLYLYDFARESGDARSRPATAVDLSPVFSPDGKRLAFLRNRRELRVLDLDSEAGARARRPARLPTRSTSRSPSGRRTARWIALFAIGAKAFTNVELVSVSPAARRRAR